MVLLRAVYAAAVRVEEDDGEKLDAFLATRKPSEVTALLNQQRIPLLTRRVSHESPLEIIVVGIVYKVLQAAWRAVRKNLRGHCKVRGPGFELCGEVSPEKVVASGSWRGFGVEAEASFDLELPTTLPQAAEELRPVLSQGSGAPISYGASERTVQLSAAQIDVLMKQDPTKARNGGFQKRLIGWQTRLNKKTRQLTLHPDDIDFILRNGSKGNAGGGWQGSIRKMFGTHFEWPAVPPRQRRAAAKPKV